MTNVDELRGRRINRSNSGRLYLALLSLCAIGATPAWGQSSPASIARECFRLGDTPRGYCSAPDSIDCPGYRTWLETCQQALAANPNDPRVKLALSLAVRVVTGKRDEAVRLMRSAAEQDDPEAWLALYEEHRSFNRRLDRPQTITRAEAEKALRRAAELGHPDAMFRLSTALYRGGVGLKRDLASARIWGERALARPPKGMWASDIQPVAAHWLSQSDDPQVRLRGIALLEALPGRADAEAYLAEAMRAGDPVRAQAARNRGAHRSRARAGTAGRDAHCGRGRAEGGAARALTAVASSRRCAAGQGFIGLSDAGRSSRAPRRRPGSGTAAALVTVGLRHVAADCDCARGEPRRFTSSSAW